MITAPRLNPHRCALRATRLRGHHHVRVDNSSCSCTSLAWGSPIVHQPLQDGIWHWKWTRTSRLTSAISYLTFPFPIRYTYTVWVYTQLILY
jgi:hypothetical protein